MSARGVVELFRQVAPWQRVSHFTERLQVKTVATLPRPITDYQSLSAEELFDRIRAAKRALGDQVMILGHNYQRDEVIQHADFRGDSLILSQLAEEKSDRPYVVFCGVHFMAETADVLSRSDQTVILPDMAAGCSMADMAAIEQVEQCWDALGRIVPVEETVMPAVYVNSAAVLKAFCGEHGGLTCTSSNARKVIEWSWARREKILFFPDEHLGRNTANKMGIPRERMIVWDPYMPRGGNSVEAIKRAKLILWKGHCSTLTFERRENAAGGAFRILSPEGHHAVERDLGPLLLIGGHHDVVHHMAVDKVFERPAKVGGVDTIHGGALANGRGEEKYLLVRLFLL